MARSLLDVASLPWHACVCNFAVIFACASCWLFKLACCGERCDCRVRDHDPGNDAMACAAHHDGCMLVAQLQSCDGAG